MFRQFYHDALPLIGTTASVSVMRSLIASQQTTSKENDIWLTSLAFIKNPTRDMMRELKVRNIDVCVCVCGVCLRACVLACVRGYVVFYLQQIAWCKCFIVVTCNSTPQKRRSCRNLSQELNLETRRVI